MWQRVRTLVLTSGAALAVGALLLALPSARGDDGKPVVLKLPIRAESPKTIDPVRGSTTYDNEASSMVYETLLQYHYLKRPYELEPGLLEAMPEISPDGKTYRFRLKKGVRFHDDPCFPGGKGRELVATDVFYSWKRMADEDNDPKSWWLFENTIVGFDAYRAAQNAAAKFDYEAPVEGMRVLGTHEFEVELTEPVYRFMWTLAMFQTSVVPREAVAHHGLRFARTSVGTGPFHVESWSDTGMVFARNPTYREEYYPSQWMPEDEALGFHESAGKRLPIVDRVEYTFFSQDQPMWLRFEEGTLAFTQVPAENFLKVFNPRTQALDTAYKRRGIVAHRVPLLDFVFRQFNMDDPVVGGYSEEKRNLRRAIILAFDFDEFNSSFYNNQCVVYDGMIPPGLDAHPTTPDRRIKPEYRGLDLELAKEYLAKAGYPNGEGLPPIEYYSSNNANGFEQADMIVRQLERIGVVAVPKLMDFPTLTESINKKKAQLFSFAWSSDYPDAENNLALFYGPNESPGSNHSNYKNPEFDRLYEKTRGMPPSPERTAIYVKMRDMVLDDAVFAGSLGRTRFYVNQKWLLNFKPTEQFRNWVKYLDVAK